jgi:hypothetical protein
MMQRRLFVSVRLFIPQFLAVSASVFVVTSFSALPSTTFLSGYTFFLMYFYTVVGDFSFALD